METGIVHQFENKQVRSAWNAEEEQWYFSVVDVVEVLTESSDARQYIKRLKARDPELKSRWGTICTPTQMIAADGKKYKTQAANTRGLLRIIQSIPSKKAEPFKLWLAQVGSERVDEIIDPELAIHRAIDAYRKKGYPESWIRQRMLSIDVRKDLTYEWQERGVRKANEFAILTDDVSKAWSGMTTREYKNLKGLKKENLRDNMTNMELILNMLAEESTTQFSRAEQPATFDENRAIAKKGGGVAGNARNQIEEVTGESVATSENAFDIARLRKGIEDESI